MNTKTELKHRDYNKQRKTKQSMDYYSYSTIYISYSLTNYGLLYDFTILNHITDTDSETYLY
jgi:hypothetical protein